MSILVGDCRETLRTIPADSVHTCVTSPPYFGLRSYGGGDAEIGRETTPDEFCEAMVDVFREVRRALRSDGTLWLNLGDSYAKSSKQRLLIPARVALALQADGWLLRDEIVWAKPSTTPESVKDRTTRAHEMVYLFAKSKKYVFDADAIRTPPNTARPQLLRALELARENGLTQKHFSAIRACGIADAGRAQKTQAGYGKNAPEVMALAAEAKAVLGGYCREFLTDNTAGANKRSVWTVASQPFAGNHFATYPPALIEPCILAGAPEGGTVLDPFLGSGTTGLVAQRLGRRWIGCELNPEHAALARDRLTAEFGLFASAAA